MEKRYYFVWTLPAFPGLMERDKSGSLLHLCLLEVGISLFSVGTNSDSASEARKMDAPGLAEEQIE